MKLSGNPKLLFVILLLATMQITLLAGRDTGDNIREYYKNAVELYHKGMLEPSYQLLQKIVPTAMQQKSGLLSGIEGYMTLIAIESSHSDAVGKFSRFERLYGESSMLPLIRFSFAGYLFDKNDFAGALSVYGTINPGRLERKLRNEYHFKTGYAHLKGGDIQQATEQLLVVINSYYDGYSAPATYYLAHTYYLKKDFISASAYFAKIEKDPRFNLLSRYYLLESHFMMGDHNYVVSNGESLYNQLSGEYKDKSARLVSESFFALGDNQKAKFYFDRYTLSRSSLSRSEIYYAAMIAYSQSKFDEAIELFAQVTGEDDSLTQNAAYHMGRCYIETKNKVEALNSFKIASQGLYDLTIKEDAMFNYAKLSFDLNSDISPFRRYLDTYSPSEDKFNEIQNYVANSYLVNQDYKSAIEALRTIRNPSSKDIVNLQKATFLRGMQLLSLGAYRDAIQVFELSMTNGQYNTSLYNVTRFWLAEAYYRNNQFRRSVEINLDLATNNQHFKGSNEYPTALYNLAYGYFKLGDFPKAESWFKRYLNLSRGEILYYDEATARLGDCLFMQRKYEDAINAFSAVSTSNRLLKQYSRYQVAIVTGLLGKEKEKGTLLKELVTQGAVSGTLYPEILYELGRTLIQTGEDDQAIAYLTELSNSYSNTTYHPKALLELGLVYLNKGESNKAIGYYKQILEENPKSPEAQNAVAGLENIYKDSGRAEEFLSYLDGLGMSQTRSSSERELIIFSSAEKQFLSGNYAQAITSLNTFLKSYPQGTKSAQAWFYLGESYQKTVKPDLALDAFLKVMEIGEGSFTELATLNYARISYNLENYRQAAKAYSSLTRIAKLENNIIEAATGLMNSYFMDRQFANAISEAGRALSLNISENDKVRCNYVIAKSHYLSGERETALRYLKELAKSKMTPEGAESTYLIISDAFDKGEFSKVEKEVYDFADSRTPQSYWLAKSYILLGDSFAERGNLEQAEATYKSILESYQSDTRDDIEEQLKIRLSRIEEIKKTSNENK